MSCLLGSNFRLVLIAAAMMAAWSAGGARITWAQTAEPTAEQMAEQARSAQAAGRFNDAIEAYARAYQLGGDANMLFYMAEAHRVAGHDAEAGRTFQTYLRRDPTGVHRDSAERQIKELEQKARGGAVARPVTPAPVVPLPVIPPAPRVAPIVTAPPVSAPVSASPPPAPTSPPSGAPAGSSNSPASTAAPSGWTTGPAATQTATTPPSVDLTTPALPPASTPGLPMPRWVPWTLGAATVALGAGAIITGLSANHRFDELNTTCGRTAQGCGSEAIDDVRSRAHRATLLWALTGVAAVATGVTVFVNASAAGVSGLWAF